MAVTAPPAPVVKESALPDRSPSRVIARGGELDTYLVRRCEDERAVGAFGERVEDT